MSFPRHIRAADDEASPPAILVELAKLASAAEQAEQSAWAGKNGWMFFTPELRALSVGPFWGTNATKVSRASNPDYADPLEPIVDFSEQLRKADIELLLVPVPAKTAVYPDMLADNVDVDLKSNAPRIDFYHRQFYELLRQRGVPVLDLLPIFIEHANDPGGPLYCKTDTHWSGQGCRLAAETIAAMVAERDWRKEATTTPLAHESRDIQITGDLAQMLKDTNPDRETLSLTFVGTKADTGLTPVEPNQKSQVLLLGDSHTLVFHDPALHAKGAGLPDHLALNFGFPVDLIGVRGSGATAARITLLRRRDNLQGKKLVIWCFSFREFTENFDGWRKVPVIR